MMCRPGAGRGREGGENKTGEGASSSMMYFKQEMASSKLHRIYTFCTFIF